jgi:cellobiose-specific phosphotransferase system component IIC
MSRSSAALRLSSAASRLKAAADLPFIIATRDALPWSFVGLFAAFVVLLVVIPVPGPIIGPTLGLRVSGALLPAFGVMGVVLAPTLAWLYAKRVAANPWFAAATTLTAYVAALPAYAETPVDYLRVVGPSGLFLALGFGGIFAFGLWATKRAWGAAAIVLALALFARAEHVSFTAIIEHALAPLGTLGDTYAALMIIVFVETLLWTCGLHGPALLAAVVTPVYLTLQMQNTNAFAAHHSLPHIVVVSLFLFVFPGGAGATLPLAALLALSRVPRLRTVGRITILPALVNTNEPLLFGAPVVFNPFLIPPFIVVPLVLATTTYVATSLGWIGRAAFYVPSSIPTLISTYLATLDVRAVGLALVNIALATAIYFPFVRAYEAHLVSND